ncbi:helix-turn-helix domain-containing protein [Pectobacterium wasabiae]|uniref:helix-turn-helix domain-containing protein n=1 Tax=Pectobacterium wasabiae TaxID=55208 RepID=UPI00027B064E|nr:helix-turn-helix domain-containing protein [Pectobacterium wasabiae]EJS96680.1 Transcriptional activator feaR [Pectobacterium wasabiae CFBP 3304]
MIPGIEGPYLNVTDPWRKTRLNPDKNDLSHITSRTIFLVEFILSFVEGAPSHFDYEKTEPKNNDYEYTLILQRKGVCIISSGDYCSELKENEMLLLSDQSPCNITFNAPWSQIVLRFNSAYITPLLAAKDIPLLTVSSNSQGAGKILLLYIEQLSKDIENGLILQSIAFSLSRSVINLVVACLIDSNYYNSKKHSKIYTFHVSRIKNYIAQNLRDPSLNVEKVSEALRLSLPHLHRIFKNEPLSISHYLWSKRLDGCAKDLSDESKSQESISSVAFSWGFNDAAHFSRVFKSRYYISPTKWRIKHLGKIRK